jgi:hypothetical protein
LIDVIALTKEQMDKIEAAVRKARSYQKIQENFKALEIAHALYESKQLEEQMESMRQAMLMMENDLHAKTSGTAQKRRNLTDLRWKETQLGEKLVEMNRRLSEIDGPSIWRNSAKAPPGNARRRLPIGIWFWTAKSTRVGCVGKRNGKTFRRDSGVLGGRTETARQSAGILAATEASYNEKSGLAEQRSKRGHGSSKRLMEKYPGQNQTQQRFGGPTVFGIPAGSPNGVN